MTVEEKDGSQQRYTVPYSTVPLLQREGRWKYDLVAGDYRSGNSEQDTPFFAQGTLITGLADGDLATIGRFFDALRAFMHFDLLDPGFDPVAAALSFVHQVLKPVGVLDGTSALAARNLFGDLAANLFRLVPLTSIGDTNPNLLDDPQFQNGDGFDGTEGVDHDPTVGRTSLGSVRFTADGTANEILSDPWIPVSQGQQVTLSAYARWAGLTGSGQTMSAKRARSMTVTALGLR